MSKKMLEKIAEAPARVLEKTIDESESMAKNIINQKPIKKARDYWHMLGPGLTTGASDDDPSGIATYSQTGARYGNQLLWLAAFTFPMMAVIQEMCARIGLVTGQGLAANIRQHFPKPVLYFCTVLLFTANTFNIGADLGAMAEATRLLRPEWNLTSLIIGFALLCILMEIFFSYKTYARYLKYLALVLFSYVFATILIPNLDWASVLRSSITPQFDFSKEQIILVCGILGTTISPYLFFWQTSQEVEEKILIGETTILSRQNDVTPKEVKEMRVDIWSGMFLSNLAMFFIITACSGTLFKAGITNITTAADAAEALRPFAGDAAYLLFAVGIIGVGLLGVPVLAGSASYAIAESFGWKQGLYRKLKQAYAFYGVIILSIIIGLILNFVGLDPVKALIYAAVINGLVAPVILILIVSISSNHQVMGERKNRKFSQVFGWLICFFMIIVAAMTLWSIFG